MRAIGGLRLGTTYIVCSYKCTLEEAGLPRSKATSSHHLRFETVEPQKGDGTSKNRRTRCVCRPAETRSSHPKGSSRSDEISATTRGLERTFASSTFLSRLSALTDKALPPPRSCNRCDVAPNRFASGPLLSEPGMPLVRVCGHFWGARHAPFHGMAVQGASQALSVSVALAGSLRRVVLAHAVGAHLCRVGIAFGRGGECGVALASRAPACSWLWSLGFGCPRRATWGADDPATDGLLRAI